MAGQNTHPIEPFDDDEFHADVIPFRGVESESFYQRNSGSLPRINGGITDSHRRSKLPKPDNPESGSFLETVRSLLSR